MRLIWLYLFPWLKFATRPRFVTEPEVKDGVIIAHSFGRNSFTDEEVYDIVNDVREGKTDTEAFRHLVCFGFAAGYPNDHLAGECERMIKRVGVSRCILQWEIAVALWQRYPGAFSKAKIDVVWPDKEYLAAKGFSEKAAEIVRGEGLRRVISVSHKSMAVRSALVLRRIFGNDTEIIILEQSTGEFDKRSVQWWTRGPVRWCLRETLVRVHHLVKGWV